MKKILSLILVIALVAGIAVTGTMAYLTDRDNETNVFTVGDVDIELSEEYAQGSQLLPGVTITKKPTIENVGKNDAWVWLTYAVPTALKDVVTVAADNTNWTARTYFTETINNVAYTVFPLLYADAIAAGEKTTAAFDSITLSASVDVNPDGAWYTVDNGTPVSLGWNNSNGAPVIYVNAYAIQTGMQENETVTTAYDKYVGQWGANLSGVYEAPKTVATGAELQAALDNAVAGTTIMLQSGVNYGVQYLRPSPNNPATKEVDWVGNNYRYETYSCFEDLTIVGAEGATIDAIEIEGGTYYNTDHSQSATYPIMLSLIELKDVVFEGITFTGKGGYDPQGHGNAINLSGNNIKVDGLTVKDCVLNSEDNNARLLYKTEGTTHVHTYTYDGETFTFVPSLKDITVTGCTFNGGYMGMELRETENLTITNNTFNGVISRDILLPVNSGCTYSGTVTISGNKSVGAKERFLRANGIGNAKLIITNNTITEYAGGDVDYIKVDGFTGEYTVSGNTATNGSSGGFIIFIENNGKKIAGVSDQAGLMYALMNFDEFIMQNDINL